MSFGSISGGTTSFGVTLIRVSGMASSLASSFSSLVVLLSRGDMFSIVEDVGSCAEVMLLLFGVTSACVMLFSGETSARVMLFCAKSSARRRFCC